MAHGTRINGTAYGITGGKCLVNGTAYSVQKGRTLVSGTGYDVSFFKKTIVTVKNNNGSLSFYAVFNGGDRVYGYPNAKELEFEAGVQVSMTVHGRGLGGISLYINDVFEEQDTNIEYTIDITGKNVVVELNQYDVYGSIYITLG